MPSKAAGQQPGNRGQRSRLLFLILALFVCGYFLGLSSRSWVSAWLACMLTEESVSSLCLCLGPVPCSSALRDACKHRAHVLAHVHAVHSSCSLPLPLMRRTQMEWGESGDWGGPGLSNLKMNLNRQIRITHSANLEVRLCISLLERSRPLMPNPVHTWHPSMFCVSSTLHCSI